MKKYSDRTLETKNNIKEAFWEIYKEKDISKITVSEVIGKAGYNRSTFYVYYSDVYAILEEIEDSVFKVFLRFNPSKNLDDITTEITEAYKTEGEYLSVLISEHGDPQFTRKLINYLLPVVKSDLRIASNDKTFDYMFEYHVNGLMSTMGLWIRKGRDIPPETILRLVRGIERKAYVELSGEEKDE